MRAYILWLSLISFACFSHNTSLAQSLSVNNHLIRIINGRVFTAGENKYGQLGNSTFTDNNLMQEVSNLDDIGKVFSGKTTSFAITRSGEVYAWGNNTNSQLGLDELKHYCMPEKLNISSVIDIAAGDYHTLFLKKDGTVWGVGRNINGVLNEELINFKFSTITQIKGLAQIIDIAAGDSHNIALHKDGSIYTWGANHSGQLGDSTKINTSSPTIIKAIKGAVQVNARGANSSAILKDGSLYVWGNNDFAQLGDGTFNFKNYPIKINSADKITYCSIGSTNIVALSENKTILISGSNLINQINHSDKEFEMRPVRLAYSNIIAVETGADCILALNEDNVLHAWGLNTKGQLASGNFINRKVKADLAAISKNKND